MVSSPLICFPAGTLVQTPDGPRPIEQVAAGDQVWSYDHRGLRWVERRVVEVFQNLNQGAMATIRVDGETIRATGGHPFWVVAGEGLAARRLPERIAAYEPGGLQPGRWVLAVDLRAGDEVLRRDGLAAVLDSVEVDSVEEAVYNFRVFELQNYAVGTCGILVHNTNQPNPAPNAAQGRIASQVDAVRRAKLDKFMETNAARIDEKIGSKLGGNPRPGVDSPTGRLPFPRSEEGAAQARQAIRDTLDSHTEVSKPFTTRGGHTTIDVYSEKTGMTVRIREDGTFDTLIPERTGRF